MSILIITTGGTIGAMRYENFDYSNDFVSTMPPKGTDYVRDALLEMAGPEHRYIAWEPRDSKLIDDTYREKILELIESAVEPGILIAHGTDTLLQTADFLYRHSRRLGNKAVMLTGSMIPLANGPESDGYRNLKFALEQLQKLTQSRAQQGAVYIVLCDYADPDDEKSAWEPRLYTYIPGCYKKIYSEDKRHSRLGRIV